MVVPPNLFCLGRGYLLRLALLLTFLILCFSLQIRNITRNALSCYFHHSAVGLSRNLRQWGWEVMSWVRSEIWFLALEGCRCGFCLSHQFRSSWCWKVTAVIRSLETRYRVSIQLLANFLRYSRKVRTESMKAPTCWLGNSTQGKLVLLLLAFSWLLWSSDIFHPPGLKFLAW